MGSSWGIGFVRHFAGTLETRAQAIQVLTRIADAVGDSVDDVVDGEPVRVHYWGSVSPAAYPDELRAAVKTGGDLTYDELTALDPYYVCFACEKPFVVELPGGKRVDVKPLRWLREVLQELVDKPSTKPESRETYRAMLETAELASRLLTIMVVGDP